jgi:hypothetical protein
VSSLFVTRPPSRPPYVQLVLRHGKPNKLHTVSLKSGCAFVDAVSDAK